MKIEEKIRKLMKKLENWWTVCAQMIAEFGYKFRNLLIPFKFESHGYDDMSLYIEIMKM